MKKVNNDTVFGILQLETLLGDINSIFSEIEIEYKMSREEILILLTLWQKGSMTLKEMDRFVEVKPYKRTRTYNNLVELEWIYKERPVDDERTVIIHFNENLNQEKVALLNFISDAIASRATTMQNSLDAITAV
ncbi:MarR family transcriptional regulator [Staphylococcus schweitzeri]|uniref:HTH-type transcriptional regulator rot n=1 Tax=Staphylococcus schweitzeri TaxID=1654388 RepID=A0A2K4AFB5_9STAP|nr:MarR family transcriptional regulator [Staphylococcus schweitzeri]MBE2128345.1 MarR family transcriptional regulator [Staphylococcus schweitzeri]PNZ48781.1 MarR family transcriptional regulator [Staphylococcus schweitzeri]CDR25871.1 Staphylococcal accessory regulator [Staphylococcus schweitzeri]CDR50555.1 Staphylococcal accessory regulator [Staphylococcus schweitzeri]CDR54182.1 Staphylococcal accessory regulator [Staphylococcus schweitzeri]